MERKMTFDMSCETFKSYSDKTLLINYVKSIILEARI